MKGEIDAWVEERSRWIEERWEKFDLESLPSLTIHRFGGRTGVQTVIMSFPWNF